jgi:organic hydroperoxide reductase OsmC/OhrA
MSGFNVELNWERKGNLFYNSKYSRVHTWTFDGGAVVQASASPHIVPAPHSDASAVDPEESFIASISSCHMLWFLALASKKKYRVDLYSDRAVGKMERNRDGKMAITKVDLHPVVVFSGKKLPDEQDYRELHHNAHESCFIANSIKTKIGISPSFKINESPE